MQKHRMNKLEKLAQNMRDWRPYVAILVCFLLLCGGVRCELGLKVDSQPSKQAEKE